MDVDRNGGKANRWYLKEKSFFEGEVLKGERKGTPLGGLG